jgi:hypothetical protein
MSLVSLARVIKKHFQSICISCFVALLCFVANGCTPSTPSTPTTPAPSVLQVYQINDDTAGEVMLWLLDEKIAKGKSLDTKTVQPDGNGKNRVYKVNYKGGPLVQVTLQLENGHTGLISYELSSEANVLPKIKSRVLLGRPTLSSDKTKLLFPVLSAEISLQNLCVRPSEQKNKTCVERNSMPSTLEVLKPDGDLDITVFETDSTKI